MASTIPGYDDELTFPPIPLATGQIVSGADGAERRIARVEVIVTADDGTESRVPLDSRLGGWWAPPAR